MNTGFKCLLQKIGYIIRVLTGPMEQWTPHPPQGVLSRYSQMKVVLKEDLASILFTSISVVRESPESTITIFPSFLEKVQM